MSLLHYSPAPSGGRRVFIAIPSYGQTSNITAFCLFQSAEYLAKAGIEAELGILQGNCHVDDARNVLVKDFLKTDCEELVFIDSDIGWQPRDLVNLINHDRDIVGASYPRKQATEDFPCLYIPGEIWSDKDGLIEVLGIPTGFMKIQRHVLEALWEKSRKYRVRGSADDEEAAEIFERGIVNGGRISGDYNFCRKWRGLGGKVFVDPSFYMEHEGSKRWEGSLGSHLRRKNGLSMDRVIDLIRKGKETDHDLIELWQDWGNTQWSASVEMLKTCIHLARQVETVVDIGSGLTSIVMAAAGAKVKALEHNPSWADKVRGVENLIVIDSPLVDYEKGRWYAHTDIDADLVVCDGPPRQLANREILFDFLKSPKCVVMDDCSSSPHLPEAEVKGKFRKFIVWQQHKTSSTAA